jgi:hypothetical protein
LPGDRIKNKVGRVRRYQGKSRAGARQPFHFFAQKRGELFQFAAVSMSSGFFMSRLFMMMYGALPSGLRRRYKSRIRR